MACGCSQKAKEMQNMKPVSGCSSNKKTETSKSSVSCCSGKNLSGKPTKCCCGTGCGCPSCNTTKL